MSIKHTTNALIVSVCLLSSATAMSEDVRPGAAKPPLTQDRVKQGQSESKGTLILPAIQKHNGAAPAQASKEKRKGNIETEFKVEKGAK